MCYHGPKRQRETVYRTKRTFGLTGQYIGELQPVLGVQILPGEAKSDRRGGGAGGREGEGKSRECRPHLLPAPWLFFMLIFICAVDLTIGTPGTGQENLGFSIVNMSCEFEKVCVVCSL